MGFILSLVVGGIVGWLASLIMRTDGQQGVILNVVVGIVGAVIAGLIFGGGNIGNSDPLDLASLLYSLIGAILFVAIVRLAGSGKKVGWIATLIGSAVGAITFIVGVSNAESAPQEASAAAIGIALAAIPYCFARAVSELFEGRK